MVDLVLGPHCVMVKVRHNLGPAARAEAPQGAVGAGAGRRAEGHGVFRRGVPEAGRIGQMLVHKSTITSLRRSR